VLLHDVRVCEVDVWGRKLQGGLGFVAAGEDPLFPSLPSAPRLTAAPPELARQRVEVLTRWAHGPAKRAPAAAFAHATTLTRAGLHVSLKQNPWTQVNVGPSDGAPKVKPRLAWFQQAAPRQHQAFGSRLRHMAQKAL
jgi:hypothetical protein